MNTILQKQQQAKRLAASKKRQMHEMKRVDTTFLETAPFRIEAVKKIKATREEVFQYLKVAENWPKWHTGITKVIWTSPLPFEEGTTRTVEINGTYVADEEFLVWEENYRFNFIFLRSNIPMSVALMEDFSLRDTDDGYCEMRLIVAGQTKGLLRFLNALMRWMQRRGIRKNLDNLAGVFDEEAASAVQHPGQRVGKLTKADFDKDLQSAYGSGKVIAAFKYAEWKISVFNFLTDTAFRRKKRIGVTTERLLIRSNNGSHQIPLVIYKPEKVTSPMPVMLYMHGGGYVSGSPEMTPGLEDLIAERPCIIVAPKYRRALEAPYPAALLDCYDALLWIKEHAEEMGGNNRGVIIAGHSAGGGLAAAITLKNRDDRDVQVAFQMPLYPMLDYRNNTASALLCQDAPIWNTRSNQVSWGHYLRDLIENNEAIPAYASPALNTDYADFPPTISFVGEFEPFRDEVVAYMDHLKKAGIPIKFKLFPKAFHGFESVVPKAKVSMDAQHFLLDAYAEYYDTYC